MSDLPEIIERKIVHKGFFDLRVDTVQRKGLSPLEFTVLSTKVEASAILAKEESGRYIITREYRHPIGHTVYSIPGGRIEPSEKAEVAAARELEEETGYKADKLTFLQDYYPMPSICDQKIHLFRAEGCSFTGKTALEAFEMIEVELLTKYELLAKLKEGALIDGILASSLLYELLY